MPDPTTRLFSDMPDRTALSLPPRIDRFIADADISPDQLLAAVVLLLAGGVVLLAIAVFGSGAQLLVATSALTAVPVSVALRVRGRRLARMVDALPELIDVLARSLRSGASLDQALREARADARPVIAAELDTLLSDLDLGVPARSALRSWVQRSPAAEVRVVAASLAIASENEAGTSHALAGVGQALRDRAALAQEIRSQAAQAVVSMQAMVLLPFGLVLVDALGSRTRLQFLTAEPLGQACLASALTLTCIGWIWMHSIVRRRL